MMVMMKTIYDYTYDELKDLLIGLGQKSYRTNQLFFWLYQKHTLEFNMMSDLGLPLISLLEEKYMIDPLTLVKRQQSQDGTVKYLFKLEDGCLIETVLMVYNYGNSVCVSSQVGCNMGCTFCASGLLKKSRNLSLGEMMAQVLYVQRELDNSLARISHVVVMGSGEPFDNYDNVLGFMKTINHDRGLAIGARHITVSTCGIIPRIKQFSLEKTQFNLAISLHASNDTLRSKLMPINQVYPIADLFQALKEYSQVSNRRITFEYILLKGVNDFETNALELSRLIKGMNAYINLIPYNVVDEHGFKAVNMLEAMKFYDKLMKLGVKCTLRQEHGNDIDAACGQLRAKTEGKL